MLEINDGEEGDAWAEGGLGRGRKEARRSCDLFRSLSVDPPASVAYPSLWSPRMYPKPPRAEIAEGAALLEETTCAVL